MTKSSFVQQVIEHFCLSLQKNRELGNPFQTIDAIF